jgi:formate transporter
VLLLGVLAGGFITSGALFSALLADGVGAAGPVRLLEGLGFSTGFFFVVLSEAALFTEANVVMPATLLGRAGPAHRVARFWVLAAVGNVLGALTFGGLIVLAHDQPEGVAVLLDEIVERKLAFRADGVSGWWRVLLSGVLANWLVGMAAFFATMGRTIIGTYIPVALAVTLFVAANFQHSPANMGYFSLVLFDGGAPSWGTAVWWNLVPAALGNLLGGTLLVALPFWWVFRPMVDR